ncbi:carbamoyltransferase HypF [Leptolyngbya iicbica]|uniref:Carbamoyltransferase n=2 Tax=Cyanophyceae TaxID=3028117 RepID=A0A4Q7E7Y5_9CYAN|nr:carbamoyltransferase HypF [Leptolyngbya sp. LK]RZM78897.1 carbamoyltransferase HypF [Leptolyngbya sp. LK]
MVANLVRPTQASAVRVETAAEIRVKGTVQGVGFRPTVYRLARVCQLRGEVYNDAAGVMIRVAGPLPQIDRLVARLLAEAPPLSRITTIQRRDIDCATIVQTSFEITPSRSGHRRTQISPDAATCPHCLSETLDPASRFYRYPFTNCTHCGPRLSIIRRIPYDRAHTSMATFALCPVCQAEYTDPLNRRFHAQPVACDRCGPQAWLERADGQPLTFELASLQVVDAVTALLHRGEIVAIKGLGGIHLACDATNEAVVQRLRDRKHRDHKPFALMVRDLNVIKPYCEISDAERSLLESPAAPIVLLKQKADLFGSRVAGYEGDRVRTLDGSVSSTTLPAPLPHSSTHPTTQPPNHPHTLPSTVRPLATSLAPHLPTLGVMLPYTPLHHLILQRLDRPIVLTSGNRSDEPQCIDNDNAREKLGDIATYFLLHDRDIVNRVDDSVVRVVRGQRQTLRRARGYAPAPLPLPPGFEQAPPILAMGGELKSTFCLMREGEAILSQHLGDLENAIAFEAYQDTLRLYQDLFEHQPAVIAADLHPDYLSTKLGHTLATDRNLPLYGIQHHHAHIAAAMVEHGLPIDTAPVLGLALDGLGYGDDDTLWGGEFLIADYQTCQRVAHFEPIAMLGGAQATRQPWRNTYAQLMNALGWEALTQQFGDLELVQFLANQPRGILDHMLTTGTRSPLASSAGRLFDAVAAAVGICRDSTSYEGQGAIELEALITPDDLQAAPYPFAIKREGDRPILSAVPMWSELLRDLQVGVPVATIAARFHLGLAAAIAQLATELAHHQHLTQVVLSGGVFQNQVLLIAVQEQLQQQGLTVLIPHEVPANDGGLALGQGAIVIARHLSFSSK